jgi:glutathione synthase/RimK-type ligase-like ATP-grasp enzyme
MKQNVPIPATVFLSKSDISPRYVNKLFEKYGSPLVLKEPSTSFSMRVEKVQTPGEFIKVAKRFIKLSDRIVAQQYVESSYDWRVGILDGEFLYACKYIIPSETFKIQATVNGHLVYCAVKSVRRDEVPPAVVDVAIRAGRAIGSGLYGVDLKETESGPCVIEVNDNPSLEGGEDTLYSDVYAKIVTYLLEGGAKSG